MVDKLTQLLMICHRPETLEGNAVLQLDPAVPGVFNGPYPLGIDPVKHAHSLRTKTHYSNACYILQCCVCGLNADLERCHQQADFPQLIQDEDVSDPGCHPHAFWSISQSL